MAAFRRSLLVSVLSLAAFGLAAARWDPSPRLTAADDDAAWSADALETRGDPAAPRAPDWIAGSDAPRPGFAPFWIALRGQELPLHPPAGKARPRNLSPPSLPS